MKQNIATIQWMLYLITASFMLLSALGEGTPTSSSYTFTSVGRNDEICGPYNGRKLYLELGERGVLQANNVSLRSPLPGSITVPSHAKCSLEIVTCPSCVLDIQFRYLNLSTCSQDLTCRCDYVWITEPPYESSGTPFCGVFPEGSTNQRTYRSQTRIVNFALLFSSPHSNAFSLEYRAERNRQVLNPVNTPFKHKEFNNSNSRGGVLNSPFFPSSYPRDLGVEYIISSTEPRARVQLLFSDFQLASASIMEFYDWNGQRIDVSSGASFRPPAVVSTGPSLLIRFYANGGAGLGYRATFTFTTDSNNDSTLRPITDCGGFVENPGGAITMMHMVEDGIKHFDCIWIVKPLRSYFHLKTYLSLKIAQFSDFGGNTVLVVRQGTTSQGVKLERLQSPVAEVVDTSQSPKELVIPVDVGFYISLRGAFSARSKLAIIYAAYSYKDCFAGADFLCKNHRCISSRLSCDGFDHCGDGSDEPAATCYQDWGDSSSMDRNWYSNTPNYFFPKIERYPDLKTATLVFLVSSLGLILLIVALIVLLYRMGARARQQRELQNRLQTISELLDSARIEEIVPDEPPTYEAPPDYDEVIKVGSSLPPAGTAGAVASGSAGPSVRSALPGRRKTKNKGNKQERRRAKSSPGVCLNTPSSREESLRVQLPLSPPPHTAHRTSWPDTQGGSAPVLLLPRTLPTSPVPDSPPPPYATNQSPEGNVSGEAMMAHSSTSLPTVEQRIQQNTLEPLLQTFEDSFSGVLQYNPGCSSHFRANNIAHMNPTTSTNNGEHLHPDVMLFPSNNVVCKLASPEQFDDLCVSHETVHDEHVPNVGAIENFANFDEVGQYPSCASSNSVDQGGNNSLTRCESTPNCSSQIQNAHLMAADDPEETDTEEAVAQDITKSRSFEILQIRTAAQTVPRVYKRIQGSRLRQPYQSLHK